MLQGWALVAPGKPCQVGRRSGPPQNCPPVTAGLLCHQASPPLVGAREKP